MKKIKLSLPHISVMIDVTDEMGLDMFGCDSSFYGCDSCENCSWGGFKDSIQINHKPICMIKHIREAVLEDY